MVKYYTRACNFYFGSTSKENIKKKISLPLHGNNLISFDSIEIITRNSTRKLKVKNINRLKSKIKKKVLFDIKQISKKKKNYGFKIFE